MMTKGLLIIYSGPSGVGKGTILAPIIQKHSGEVTLSISATTRKPRPGELEGIHYHFVSREQFEGMINAGEMLEYAEYNGNYYGTPKKFVQQRLDEGKNVILEIETRGAAQIKKLCPEALSVFVLPPSFGALRERLLNRATETEQQVRGRIEAAKREIALAYDYDFVIINDDLESSRAELMDVIRAGRNLSRLNKKFINEVLEDAKTVNE